eukprot:14542667-Alexandrium_andersonii.AAC.1
MGRGAIPGGAGAAPTGIRLTRVRGPGPRMGMWARGTPRAHGARGTAVRPRARSQTFLTPGLAGILPLSASVAFRARVGPAATPPADPWST